MVQKSTGDIKKLAAQGYYSSSIYKMPIKPETKLLSSILLPDEQPYLDDEILFELNGVPLSQALYNVLGEVSQEARHQWSFSSKVQKVMALRYGLLDGQFRPLEDVGKIVGMSRQGIHIIERRALDYLRHLRYSRKLLAYVKSETVE